MATHYQALLAIAVLLALLPAAGAFYTSPIFSGFQGNCTQLNSTFISCDDAVPIHVSFSISARYAQYYGNFSVYSTTPNNVSEPIGLNGRPCSVPSSSTVTCAVTLSPIPITTGNGIAEKAFTMLLISSNYPQVSFESSFNVTVAHNLTPFQTSLLSSYSSSYSNFAGMYKKYLYFCDTYGICSSSLSANMSAANSTFRIVNESIGNSMLNEAYQNLTAANYSVLRMGNAFSAFMNRSNIIVNNILKARAMLVNMQNIYAQNKTKLSKCTLANGTTYAKAINSSIARLGNAESIATVGASYLYLNKTIAARTNESSLISECMPIASLPGISLNLQDKYVLYAVVAVIIVLALYSTSKLFEARSIRALRSGHEEAPDASPSAEIQPEEALPESEAENEPVPASGGGKGKEESSPASSLEDEFDNWLGSIINKQPEKKPAEKGKSKKQG